MMAKTKTKTANFNLHLYRPIKMFTKWKRSLTTEEDKLGYFQNF